MQFLAISLKNSSMIFKYFLKNVVHRFLNQFLKNSRSPTARNCGIRSLSLAIREISAKNGLKKPRTYYKKFRFWKNILLRFSSEFIRIFWPKLQRMICSGYCKTKLLKNMLRIVAQMSKNLTKQENNVLYLV